MDSNGVLLVYQPIRVSKLHPPRLQSGLFPFEEILLLCKDVSDFDTLHTAAVSLCIILHCLRQSTKGEWGPQGPAALHLRASSHFKVIYTEGKVTCLFVLLINDMRG